MNHPQLLYYCNDLDFHPSYQHKMQDAGFDLRAKVTDDGVILPGESKKFHTGCFFAIPDGYQLEVRPRSSLGFKNITLSNSPGTIDAGYRGEVMVKLINHSNEPYQVEHKERICQCIYQQAPQAQFKSVSKEEFEALPTTTRGTGGFGSTGRTN